MKIAFASDIHVANRKQHGGELEAGLNVRCREILTSVRWAIADAAHEGCGAFVVAGDLFDSAKPEPQLVRAVQAEFEQARIAGMEVVVLAGNHDIVTSAPGDNALGPLKPVARVVEVPMSLRVGHTWTLQICAVPFQPGNAAEWLPDVLAKLAINNPHPARVLVLHLGVVDDSTVPWLREAHDVVTVSLLEKLAKLHNLQHIFAGNHHMPRDWEYGWLHICQMGSMVPTGFGDDGLDRGHYVLFDSETSAWPGTRRVEVPGPRFVRTVADARRAQREGHTVYARLPAGSDTREVAVGKGTLMNVEIDEPDTTETQVALRQAAGMARQATTVDEALEQWVAAMPLAREDIRQDVLARVKRYAGAA
jgi:DNA repair exonuclease SbcCD nuclease subunit